MLKFESIVRRFAAPAGEVTAVDGVSLSIARGEFAAVKGPSGSGKTTLLLMAGGLLRPSGGRVEVAGDDPYAMSPNRRSAWRARTIGFVFQQFHLIPYLSVLDNILAPAVAAPDPDAAARAHAMLDRFGLSPRAGHIPAQLSAGERQRTALARALLNQPSIILADEPTGNLDADNATELLNCLGDYVEQGGTVMLVTHEDRALAHVSRVIHLAGGGVVEA